jgi:hypothetical protein
MLFQNVLVAFGEEITVAEADDYRFFAGIRSDPFFKAVLPKHSS